MKKLRAILSGAILLSLTAALCGCTGGTDGGTGNNSTGNQSPDTVVFGTTLGLEGLDPHGVIQAGTRAILYNVYEGLLKPTPDGDVAEAVAESYTVSEDGATYTFKIRDGIKFHDESDVTAKDVKYSLERYAAGHNGQGEAFSTLKEVVIVDDNTVNVVFTENNNELLYAFTLASIIPESIGENIATNPVGTGAYKYVSYTEGENLKLAKNDNYWGEKAKIANAEFKLIADESTAYQMLQSGSIDVLPYLSADQVKTLSEGTYSIDGYMSYVFQLFLDSNYGPLKDPKVRQAINYAVDVDEINNLAMDGKADRVGANIMGTITKYCNEDIKKAYNHDVEKAKQLLKEAGYENGFDLKIAVPDVNPVYKTAAEVTVENLKEIGINVSMEMMETEKWMSIYSEGLNDEYQAMFICWDAADLSPGTWMNIYTSTASNNFMHYKNADYDALYAKAKAAAGDEKVKLYKDLQKVLSDDAAAVFLFTPADFVGMSERTKGYEFYPATVWDLSKLYFE